MIRRVGKIVKISLAQCNVRQTTEDEQYYSTVLISELADLLFKNIWIYIMDAFVSIKPYINCG